MIIFFAQVQMFQIKNRLKKMENRVGILKQGTIVVLPGENKESKLSEYKKKFPGAPPPKVIAVQFVKSMTGIERSEAKAS